MTDEQGYNGWKNYETWSVALIIDNDESTQAEAFEITRDAVENGEPSEVWTEGERRRYRTADALKDWVEACADEDMPDQNHVALAGLWAQLLSAALSEVDWNEIADHYLESLDEIPA